MKRSLTGIIAATMVLGTAIPAAFADASSSTTPNDISGNQYATAIGVLVNMGTQGDATNPEVLNLYSDGSFRPDLGVSRGQFIAYVYNVLKDQQVITKDYNQDTQPYVDENNFFRNQINDMYLYGFLNNLDLGNGAIGQNYKTPAWWAAQLLCNVAGISYDSSKPYDALNQARAQGWFDNTPDKSANPNYYLSRGEMAQVLFNFYKQQYPDAFTGVVASATLAAANATTSAGVKDQLTVSATDVSGKAVDLTSGHTVTYTVTGSNASDAAVTSAGNFVAASGGKYTVVATVDGVQTAPITINVYGQPAGLTVSANKDLVAGDGVSNATVTVNVNDSNGNVVTNYNGPVTLTSSNGTDASVGSNTTATLSQTVNAVNGVATFSVYALGGATAGDAPTLTASVTSTSGTITGSTAEKVDAPVASSFSVGYAPNMPNGLAVNGYSPQTAVQITALDQAGNKISSFAGSATVSISGPATLLGGSATSMTAYFSNGQSNSIYLLGKQGVTGNVVVTVSATGLNNTTFTVPAYVQTAATSLSATASANSVTSGGQTTLTIKELDANGNLAVLSASGNGTQNNDTITLSDDSGSGKIAFYAADGKTLLAGNQIQLTNGQATVVVQNNGFIGTANVKLAGSLLNTAVPLAFTNGSATQAVPVSTGVYAAPGSTQTVTFQLEDGANNPVKVAGDTFSLVALDETTSLSNVLSSTTATSDANGKFSVTVTLPSNNVGDHFYVTATGTGNNVGVNGKATYITEAPGGLAASVTGNVYNVQTGTTTKAGSTTLTAGDIVDLDVYGLNAIQGTTGSNDSYTVTSSNPNVVAVTYPGSATSINGAAIGSETAVVGQPHVQLQGLLAGTTTITVQDTSVVGSVPYSFTVTVNPGTKPGGIRLLGLPSTVVAGQTYALTVELTDKGGNPVFQQPNDNGNNGLQVGLTDTYNGFRTAANGYTIGAVTIPAYGNSTVVYWTAPASGSVVNLGAHALYTPATGSPYNIDTTAETSLNNITVH